MALHGLTVWAVVIVIGILLTKWGPQQLLSAVVAGLSAWLTGWGSSLIVAVASFLLGVLVGSRKSAGTPSITQAPSTSQPEPKPGGTPSLIGSTSQLEPKPGGTPSLIGSTSQPEPKPGGTPSLIGSTSQPEPKPGGTPSLIGSTSQPKPKPGGTLSLIGSTSQPEPEPNGSPSLIGSSSTCQPEPNTSETPSLIGSSSTSQPKLEPNGLPSLIGAPSTSQRRYKRTSGAADGAGEDYEWKMLTLVFLRMLSMGHEFQLASNMEAAGAFDDIVLRYRKHSSGPWTVAYLQLKHKQNKSKTIPKPELLGLSGTFSLLKYCGSFELILTVDREIHQLDEQRIILFTNASINDSLVDLVESDPLLSTGGRVVSFKAGGEVYRELCEWVDFKEAVTELQGQVDGLNDEELKTRVNDVLGGVEYQNKAVNSEKIKLTATPNLPRLGELLKKLEIVRDKATYSAFLAKLQVYTDQAHESQLNAMIKEQLDKVWIEGDNLETEVMLRKLGDSVHLWWKKDNSYLTQDSHLWLHLVKSQTEVFSKSTIDELTKCGVEFVESSLQVLLGQINDIAGSGGIFHLRVDSRTAASSLKVHQALAKYDNVIHVNMKALLDREDDVLSAWATRWCPVLVVECDAELEPKHAARIGERILKVVGKRHEKKLLVLIAPQKHELIAQLYQFNSFWSFNDNFMWSDLTVKSKESILSTKIFINGTQSKATLSELLDGDSGFINKTDLDVISYLIDGNFCIGKELDEVGKFFVTRRLREGADGVPFVVNSVSDVRSKVVLVVAESGMGKSTLITHVAKSAKVEDPSAWIVHIKLNDCSKYLKEIDVEHFNEVAARKILEQHSGGLGKCLGEMFLGPLEHKLVVLVDGVDEVCPHYETQVFKLLSFFKDMKFRGLWVASRPVFQTKLETTLNVNAFSMIVFSEEDRKEFFNKVCMEKNPSATPEEYNEATERLLTWLTDSLGEDNPILGVPLMTAMIAEMYQDRMLSGNCNKAERLDVMSLYKTFVAEKFHIYCVEKRKIQNRDLAANISEEDNARKQMYHNHHFAALRVLFRPKEIARLKFEGKEKFDEDLTAYLKEVSDGREKIGIISNVNNGNPHFVHRSFSEYFAATFLATNFRLNKKFVKHVIFSPAYQLVSEMFHRCLAEDRPLHVAVLNRDLEATKRMLSDQPEPSDVNALDAGGRTPLHLAVLLSGTDPHPDCIRIVEYLVREHKARLDVADEVLGLTPLRYAELTRAWTELHVFLENCREDEKSWLNIIDMVEGWPKPDSSSMLDAARNASLLVVRYLVEDRDGTLECRGPKGETMMHVAAEEENVETLQYLVGHGLDLEAVNNLGLTALQVSAQNGMYEVMSALLKLNASFKVKTSSKAFQKQLNTCLLCAAFAGSLESVQTLIEMGASDKHEDNNGHPAAWFAMHKEHFELMNWLLFRGSPAEETALHGACRLGETEIVSLLLDRGEDIEAKGWLGRTPLQVAAWSKNMAVVVQLLGKGARKSLRLIANHVAEGNEANSQVPADLQGAAKNGPLEKIAVRLEVEEAVRLEIEEWLNISPGVDTSIHSTQFKASLLCAAFAGSLMFVHTLLEIGASLDKKDNSGPTAAFVAMHRGHFEVLNWLLLRGCFGSDTPLHGACRLGDTEIVSLLLDSGVDIEASGWCGQTPLHAATQSNELDVVQLLLEEGACIECRDKDGVTPLYHAAKEGNDQAVSLLLFHGADVNAKDGSGLTPLDLVTLPDVVQLLEEAGARHSVANIRKTFEKRWLPDDLTPVTYHDP